MLLLGALCSIGCGVGGETGPRYDTRVLATEGDAGVEPPPGCDWYVYWLAMIDQERPCNWGKLSHDPTVALFRSVGGECLVPTTTVCGLTMCSDITGVREKQVLEIWGPAGLTDDDVWRVTESFDCVPLE